MDEILEQKKEALKALGEYLEKLIPGMDTLCKELKGDRQEDTDIFQKQCVDGLNWSIEVYNRVSDILDKGKIHTEKSVLNEKLIELGGAIKAENDTKIVELLEETVIPFLKDISALAKM